LGVLPVQEQKQNGSQGQFSGQVPEQLKGTLGELPPEQQKLLSQLYQLSTQHPDARVMSWKELQSAANLYEVITIINYLLFRVVYT
jgi:hypothetical protein